MLADRKFAFLVLFLSITFYCNAQIEVAHLSTKGYKAVGFGGFLNFAIPISESNYATIEGGLQYFNNKKYDDAVALIPVLAGFRYTLNQTGTGFYVEPNAGYCFGGSVESEEFNQLSGFQTGVGFGYLFEPNVVQFNVALRYEHSFGPIGANVIALRVSHAFSFGRRNE